MNKRDRAIESIRATTPLDQLKIWAWRILTAPYEEARVMYAENPAALDAVVAYVRELEGEPRQLKISGEEEES